MIKQKMKSFLYRSILSIHWHEDDQGITLRALICKRTGKELLVERALPVFTDLEELLAALDRKMAIVLSVTGKGVLQSTEGDFSVPWPDLLHQRLPGADSSQFSGQMMRRFELLNIIRKDRLDQIIEQFVQKKFSVVASFIGTSPLESIVSILNNDVVWAPPYQLQFHNGQVESLRPLPMQTSGQFINFGQQRIDSCYLICFSAAVSKMIEYTPHSYNEEELHGKRVYELNHFTKWIGLTGLGIIFIALLINFLLYSQSSAQLNQIEGELYYSQGLIEKRDSLSLKVQQRQAALGDQVIRQSQISRLADQLALSLPQGIRLKTLDVFPIKKASPSDRSGQIAYQEKVILVQGETSENNLISTWIRALTKNDWIGDVQLLPHRSGKDGVIHFEIKILLEN